MTRSSTNPAFDPAVRATYDARDAEHWARLEDLIARSGLPLREIIRNYAAFLRRRDLPHLLGRYELFRKIENLPGSVAELGVFRGAGLFTWANLLETFCPGDRTRKAYGFDHFEGYGALRQEDGAADPWIDRTLGRMISDGAFVQELVNLHNQDNLLPGVERCRVIDGNIATTVPDFATQNQGLRLSLLYFDIGTYEPTMVGLEYLYPLVVTGGIVAFNGYGMPPWQGEATAVEEYFGRRGGVPAMHKFPFSTVPYAYFVKGAD